MPKTKATQQLIDLFLLQAFGWIFRPNLPNTDWTTNNHHPLSPGEFVRLHQDPEKIIGVRFSSQTQYLMSDIDRGSSIHPFRDLLRFHQFLNKMAEVGLTDPIIGHSSDSEGIHVYWVFDRLLPTFNLAAAAKQFLTESGFTVAKGELEIFPNPKSFAPSGEKPTMYNGHRLPCQPNSGWVLLDRDGDTLYSEDCSYQAQVEDFINRAQTSEQDIALLDRQIEKYSQRYRDSRKKTYGSSGNSNYSATAAAWKQDLEESIEVGWTGQSQTNDLLFLILEYVVVFEGVEGRQQQIDRIKEIAVNCPGYQQYCGHQRNIDSRIRDIVKGHKYYAYGTAQHQRQEESARVRPKSQVRQTEVKNRLIASVEAVRTELGKLPDRIGDLVNEIQAKSQALFGKKFGNNTLNSHQYKVLWHPNFLGESEPEMTENRQQSEMQSEQAITYIPLSSYTDSKKVVALSLKAIAYISALYVGFLLGAIQEPAEPVILTNSPNQPNQLFTADSKKETLPALTVQADKVEIHSTGQEAVVGENFIYLSQVDPVQEIDRNEQNQQSISEDYGISPRARFQKAISQNYQSSSSKGGLVTIPDAERFAIDVYPDTPIPGMRVHRRHHIDCGKEYPEIFGVVTDSDGLRSSVLTDHQQQFYISDYSWLSTWFPAPS
jgi:hypothetical protein